MSIFKLNIKAFRNHFDINVKRYLLAIGIGIISILLVGGFIITNDVFMQLLKELQFNLISETIGIAATVLIVDRILAWRENRRWRRAEAEFASPAYSHAREIISSWEKWISLIDHTPNKEPSAEWIDALYGLGILPNFLDANNAGLTYQEIKNKLSFPIAKNAVSPAVKNWLVEFSYQCTARDLDKFKAYILLLLVRRDISDVKAWSTLIKDIDRSLGTLNMLIGRFPIFLKPELSRSIISLSIHIDSVRPLKMVPMNVFRESSYGGVSMADIPEALSDSLKILRSLESMLHYTPWTGKVLNRLYFLFFHKEN